MFPFTLKFVSLNSQKKDILGKFHKAKYNKLNPKTFIKYHSKNNIRPDNSLHTCTSPVFFLPGFKQTRRIIRSNDTFFSTKISWKMYEKKESISFMNIKAHFHR